MKKTIAVLTAAASLAALGSGFINLGGQGLGHLHGGLGAAAALLSLACAHLLFYGK